jgi:hypothetical protein
MNLAPPASTPHSRRPHQTGRAFGFSRGVPISVPVTWMVDTGSDIGVVRKSVGDSFDLVATGASASPTTGGGGIIVKTGLDAQFAAEDSAGTSYTLRASPAVGVKPNDAGSDVLGMDQLAAFSVEVLWNPSTRIGSLRVRTGGPPSLGSPPPAKLPSRFNVPPAIKDRDTWIDVGGVRVEKRFWRRF